MPGCSFIITEPYCNSMEESKKQNRTTRKRGEHTRDLIREKKIKAYLLAELKRRREMGLRLFVSYMYLLFLFPKREKALILSQRVHKLRVRFCLLLSSILLCI